MFNITLIKLKKKLPFSCPSCSSELEVTELSCLKCGTKISGDFPLPAQIRMSGEEQKFILDFVKCSGSLKTMAKQLKLSYPTVRNMLDDIIEKLKEPEQKK